jgi:UDPglucose--hexose-1-phosphate uridylyltransferase
MELRKDPITQSWVILGQREARGDVPEECPLEPAKIEKLRFILTWPAEGAWQVRVLPHPEPLYHIEGEPGRLAEGMYDKMGALGAHEVVVETPLHDKRMSQFSDEEIERVLWVCAVQVHQRIQESGGYGGRGMAARPFASNSNYFRAAANQVRVELGARMVQG